MNKVIRLNKLVYPSFPHNSCNANDIFESRPKFPAHLSENRSKSPPRYNPSLASLLKIREKFYLGKFAQFVVKKLQFYQKMWSFFGNNCSSLSSLWKSAARCLQEAGDKTRTDSVNRFVNGPLNCRLYQVSGVGWQQTADKSSEFHHCCYL